MQESQGPSEPETLQILEEGQMVHLQGYEGITVFCFVAKKDGVDDVATNKAAPICDPMMKIIKGLGCIVVNPRVLKQTLSMKHGLARAG